MLSAGEIGNVAGVAPKDASTSVDTPTSVVSVEKPEKRKDVGLIVQEGLMYGGSLEQKADLYFAVGWRGSYLQYKGGLSMATNSQTNQFAASLHWDKTPLTRGSEMRGTGIGVKMVSDINVENPLILGSLTMRVPFLAKNSPFAMVMEMDMGADISGNYAGMLTVGFEVNPIF